MGKCKPWQIGGILCVLLCALAVLCVCAVLFLDRRCGQDTFRRAAVAADSQKCSDIGRDMLKQGGSAVDGAIAALLCTGLVNPQSMGLGGGSIFTIKDQSGKVKVFSSRETVPQIFKPNLLSQCNRKSLLITGSSWIGVPGELRGYWTVHQRYGRLPWARLFEPSIRLAREGFPVPPYLGMMLNHFMVSSLVKSSSLCKLFCDGNGKVLQTGDTLRFLKLAETMETLAREPDALYTGSVGADLIKDIKDEGGTLSMQDLQAYRVREVDPWTVRLKDAVMHFPPPPAGGALLALILNIMKGFDLSPRSLEGSQRVETFHRYVEALKFANGQRGAFLDPDFNPGLNASRLIDPSFADLIRAKITDDGSRDLSYYSAKPSADHTGTTHVSVLGEDGLAVSVTSTINQVFGAAVYSNRTGLILNNELADFCYRAKTLTQGEQPPSSMAPVILELSSGGILAMGGSGGTKITTAMALSIMNHLWLGKSLKEAIAAPIVFVGGDNKVMFEENFDKAVEKALIARGHQNTTSQFFLNVVNAVAKERGCITAVSDTRKHGRSAGY